MSKKAAHVEIALHERALELGDVADEFERAQKNCQQIQLAQHDPLYADLLE